MSFRVLFSSFLPQSLVYLFWNIRAIVFADFLAHQLPTSCSILLTLHILSGRELEFLLFVCVLNLTALHRR